MFGKATTAEGKYSTAFGTGTIATADNSLAIGKYNDSTTGALFSVGNGTGGAAHQRKNAFEVKADGLSLFSGDVRMAGGKSLFVSNIKDSGTADLSLEGYYGLSLSSGVSVVDIQNGSLVVQKNGDVKVQGDLEVDGKVIIAPQGGISMGQFTAQ